MDAKTKGLVVMYCAYYITSGLIFNKMTFELFRRDPHIFHNAQLQLWKIFIRNIDVKLMLCSTENKQIKF